MSRLSLRERLWGGRVTDPPIKAVAERRQKNAFLALLSHSFPNENSQSALVPMSRAFPDGFGHET
ncbi:MAG: hypothetical protein PsegKO_16800 [Pseudohongiellaceae bacterium]|jgi:hypothetical protein